MGYYVRMYRVKPKIQRILKRIDRSLTGPLVEFSEQFLYGHREILINYAQLSDEDLIFGSVEHGWAFEAGLGIPKFPLGRHLHLSWCEDRMKRTGGASLKNIAIGAPFIYAHANVIEDLKKFESQNIKPKRKIIFFPFHGNEYIQQNADSQISIFKARYNPEETTVCLYWAEYINPEIYSKYLSEGFAITCAGFSGQMEHTGLGYSSRKLAGSPIGGRPTFLLNTIKFLAKHDRVVVGAMGTICFYAAYMDKPLEILFDYANTTILDIDFNTPVLLGENKFEIKWKNFISLALGEDFEKVDYSGVGFRQLARSELGVQHMKTKNELYELLKPFVRPLANPQSSKIYKNKVRTFSDFLVS